MLTTRKVFQSNRSKTNPCYCRKDKEEYFRLNVQQATQEIINKLWQQSTRISEDQTSILAALPQELSLQTKLPREKPLPKPKVPTRWEKFAKAKGVGKFKSKKSEQGKTEWNEETKEWLPTYGYNSHRNAEPWVIEVKPNEDPMEDKFAKLREEKKGRVEKNKKQQMRNIQEAAGVTGAAAAAANSKSIDTIEQQLKIAKKNTASMGKFDKEIDTKGALKLKRDKRKFDAVAKDNEEVKVEVEKIKKIAKKVVDGIKEPKVSEKAVNRYIAEEEHQAHQKKGKKFEKKSSKKVSKKSKK